MGKREEFKKRFRFTLAGIAAYGHASEAKDGPMKKIQRAYEVPNVIEPLMDMMLDFLEIEKEKGTK